MREIELLDLADDGCEDDRQAGEDDRNEGDHGDHDREDAREAGTVAKGGYPA